MMNNLMPFTIDDMRLVKKNDRVKYLEMEKIYWAWRKKAKDSDKREILSKLRRVLKFLEK